MFLASDSIVGDEGMSIAAARYTCVIVHACGVSVVVFSLLLSFVFCQQQQEGLAAVVKKAGTRSTDPDVVDY